MPRRKNLILLSLLLVLTVAAGLWSRRLATSSDGFMPQTDLPRGRWRLAVPRGGAGSSAGASAEELARTISLPYVSGSEVAPAGSGVTVFDRERTLPGLNLYTSGHAPEVILMSLDARVVHRWRYPFERAFPGKAPTDETPFFRRAQLLADGTLLAIYQGGGLVALDPASRLLWKVDVATYNDFFVAPDGSIALLTKEAKRLPAISPDQLVLEDSILFVGPRGEKRGRISLLRALLDSPFAGLFAPHPEAGDILHANTVEIFDGRLAARSPLFAAGNLLVSFREIDTIGIVDGKTHRFVWARRGPWAGQHQPTLLTSGPSAGKILLFDNQPRGRDSFALEVDPLSEVRAGASGWRYPPLGGPPRDPKAGPLLASQQAGTCERLPNGNTLITESERGRALEVTREGEIVWEFLSPHRAGKRNELVATLFEVVRVPADQIPAALSADAPTRRAR